MKELLVFNGIFNWLQILGLGGEGYIRIFLMFLRPLEIFSPNIGRFNFQIVVNYQIFGNHDNPFRVYFKSKVRKIFLTAFTQYNKTEPAYRPKHIGLQNIKNDIKNIKKWHKESLK